MEAPPVVVVVGEVAQVFVDGLQDTTVLRPPSQGVSALACGFVWSNNLQGDPSGWYKPFVDLDLGCSKVAYQLPELLELSQHEVFTNLMGHPVFVMPFRN